MNKDQLVTQVSREINEPKSVVYKCLDGVIEVLTNALIEGKRVKLHEFGAFETYERKARRGINPSTLEKIDIPASLTVKFRPSESLIGLFSEGSDRSVTPL